VSSHPCTGTHWELSPVSSHPPSKKKSHFSRTRACTDGGMECYICTETEGVVHANLCACTDRAMHLACQQRLLDTLPTDGRCSVCKRTYSNLRLAPGRMRWKRVGIVTILFLSAVIAIVLGLYASAELLSFSGATSPLVFCLVNCTTPACRTSSNTSSSNTSSSNVTMWLWSDTPPCIDLTTTVRYGSLTLGVLSSTMACVSSACAVRIAVYAYAHPFRETHRCLAGPPAVVDVELTRSSST
jgi:hypothetical protein